MQLTAVFMPVPEAFIAFVEELPGANTQGATLDETRENLWEAVQMVLEANRELAQKSLIGRTLVRLLRANEIEPTVIERDNLSPGRDGGQPAAVRDRFARASDRTGRTELVRFEFRLRNHHRQLQLSPAAG